MPADSAFGPPTTPLPGVKCSGMDCFRQMAASRGIHGRKIFRKLAVFCATLLSAAALSGQSTFQIQSANPASVPAGVNGVTLALSGTLPDFTQGTYQVCFYTGYGSTAALSPTPVQGVATITVPASTIQSIPPVNFTAANGFTVQASVSIVPSASVCNGTFDSELTNSLAVPVVEPTLGVYSGPTEIPQTNSASMLQAPPTSITLAGNNFVAGSTLTFGSFGSVTPKVLTPNSLSVPVPAAFSSSPVGTAASLTVCNTGGATNFCSTPARPINLTVVALTPSTGKITVTPTPVTTGGQTVLTAQFAQAANNGQSPVRPGAPSGTVTFTADGVALPAAPLILDKTATFSSQLSTVSAPKTATPVISPAAGSYIKSATITIADSTPGATIYLTQDGSTPTTASPAYSGPFSIATSQTIKAIAAASGYLNSAVASSAYTITISPPTQVVFVVQPSNTASDAAITPAVQVAVEDVNGNTVTSYTGAVTVALSSNPGEATLLGTTTVSAVAGIATFSDLSLTPVATGYKLTATSGSLTPATSAAFNITPPAITMTVVSQLIGIGSTLNGSFTLSQPAPTGGVTVTLASSVPANATIAPATVNVAAGQTTGAFTYTGVASGNSTLSASAPNYATGTVQVTGTAAQVSLSTIPTVAPGQMVSLALSLPSPAPPGGTTVTFTSSNPNVATVTASVFVPAGQQTAAANPQVTGIIIGTTTITAFAPGFAPATRVANVTVTATFNPQTTYLNLTTSTNTTLNISAPAQVGGITFTLKTDDPTVATVPAHVTLIQGATSVAAPITGVAAGTTTVRADSPGVTEAMGSVNVSPNISVGSLATGYHLENYTYISLPVAPQTPVTVTVTSNGPAIATISSSGTVVGGTALTFTNVTSSGVGYVYFQGQSVGTTTLTVSAPGYVTGSGTITVYPTGFLYYYNGNFSTTTYAAPTNLTVYTASLVPGTAALYQLGLPLNPGLAPISIPVTSSNTAVGTITTSPIVFHAGDGSDSTTFQPASAGTTNLNIGAPPAGYTVPSQGQSITATVTTPVISVNNATTGIGLETYGYISLPVAPPAGITVTVTSSAPTVASISSSATAAGGSTVTFTNVTTGGVGYIYIQGQAAGTSTLTVSAPGYVTGTATITVNPSGFVYYYTSSFSTTTFSSPTQLNVSTAVLTPDTLTVSQIGLPINPGHAPINVPVSSSSTSVGTITSSPIVFHPGDTTDTTTFKPVAAGMTNLTLGTPTGFSTPSQYQQVTATVTAPAISVGNLTIGVRLQTDAYISLPVAPPAATTVTVTSSSGTIAAISKDGTVVGGASLTFPNVTTSGVGYVYFQGESTGSATLTVSAPGYTSGTSTITVDPSGFAFYGTPNFTTTTFSSATSLMVYPVALAPDTLAVAQFNYQISPGVGPVSVPVTSSNTPVGTISTSPLVFHPGDSSNSTTFQPVAAGTSTISVGTPTGFSTPSNYTQGTATVTAPAISIGNPSTGAKLQTTLGIYLPVAPPNPVTVTVITQGPAIATLSNSNTVVGVTTLTFPNVTSGYVGTIYVQGQTVGSTTITVSAPGYTNGIGSVTVNPSGFAFGGNTSFTTTTTSGPQTLTIYPYALTPGTLTIVSYPLEVNPGLGAISVPITSSDKTVGTITTSPIVFNAGDSSDTSSFQPLAVGTSTISIGTPTGFSTPSQYQQITATVQAP
jgi:trimeric autotransporter adhesin